MLKHTKLALAAAMIFGVASAAVAGEGSPDMAVPGGYSDAAAPIQLYDDDALNAFASEWVERPEVRGYTAGEKALFDRATGHVDGN